MNIKELIIFLGSLNQDTEVKGTLDFSDPTEVYINLNDIVPIDSGNGFIRTFKII